MSDGNPIPWTEAAEKAAAFIKLIQRPDTPLRLAGSLRRKARLWQTSTVNDVELVAMPPNRTAYLARLDTLVADGTISRAVYADGNERWGEKYCGLVFQGIRIEIFQVTEVNAGYITWLRTGPGDGNKYVMTALGGWPIRFEDGEAWYVTYERGLKQPQFRVRVPDEATLFTLLGLPCLDPERRTETIYRALWKARLVPSMPYIESLKIVDVKQERLI